MTTGQFPKRRESDLSVVQRAQEAKEQEERQAQLRAVMERSPLSFLNRQERRRLGLR